MYNSLDGNGTQVTIRRAHPWTQAKEAGVARLLRHAARFVKDRGWVQGVSHEGRTGRVDIQGALCLAAKISPYHITESPIDEIARHAPQRQRVLLLAAWELLDGALQEDPVEWNDNIAQTAEEVVGVLENMAGLLEIAL